MNNSSETQLGIQNSGRQLEEQLKKPLISIITIVKNNEKTIEQTFSSVFDQKYDNLEYIVIDGCSNDNTVEIIKKYQDRLSYWISEKDEGISDAFNKGILACHGDIIGIINADDWYEDNVFSKVSERFVSDEKIDIVHGYMRKWSTSSISELIFSDERFLEVDSTVNHPTVFVRKGVYSKIGLFRKDFKTAMDYEWLLRAKLSGYNFSRIDECLSNMRASGVSNRQWVKATLEVLKAKNLHVKDLQYKIYVHFILQIIRIFARICLEKVGLRWIVKTYHSHYSLVTKKA